VIGDRGRSERAAFRSYGTNLGLAFQLIDDALDYDGNSSKLGKRIGDDFREGKITLPVVLSYRRGTDDDRGFWRRVLEEGAIADGDLERAVGLIKSHRAIDDTVERAGHFGDVARDALAPFPESAYKSALLEAVDFCIGRAS
jgi:octaprenyl-diphosphate synthase